MCNLGIVIVIASVIFCVWSNPAKYSSRFDTLNVDEILRSERLLQNYFNCLMDKGPCSPEGSDLRKRIPDALKTDCMACTEKQRSRATKTIEYLQKNQKKLYDQLEAKYDPEGIYRARQERKKKEKKENS